MRLKELLFLRAGTGQGVTKPRITEQPKSYTIELPSLPTTHLLKIDATGSGLTYQWQKSVDGSSWSNITGATGKTCTINESTSNMDDRYYRCVVTDTLGTSVNSAVVEKTITGIRITATIDPSTAPHGVAEGTTVTFSVTAAGQGLSYQWYIQQRGYWSRVTGATSASYSLAADSQHAQNIGPGRTVYRCDVTNSHGETEASEILFYTLVV